MILNWVHSIFLKKYFYHITSTNYFSEGVNQITAFNGIEYD